MKIRNTHSRDIAVALLVVHLTFYDTIHTISHDPDPTSATPATPAFLRLRPRPSNSDSREPRSRAFSYCQTIS